MSVATSKVMTMDLNKGECEEGNLEYGTPRKSSERVSTAEASRATIMMSTSSKNHMISSQIRQLEKSPA